MTMATIVTNILSTLESKVISVFHDLWCNLHAIGNHFVEYEHPRSKMKDEFALLAIEKF